MYSVTDKVLRTTLQPKVLYFKICSSPLKFCTILPNFAVQTGRNSMYLASEVTSIPHESMPHFEYMCMTDLDQSLGVPWTILSLIPCVSFPEHV